MTYLAYVIAFGITFTGFIVNIVFCLIDAKEFKKLRERVKALEEDKK